MSSAWLLVLLALLKTSRRTLPIFLEDSVDDSILRNNRIVALDFMRTLSEKSELILQETCILAWGQIAR